MDYPAIIKNSHWSDLLLALGYYHQNQYQFALSTTYQQFWETCPKGEWLLYWIVKEKSTEHKLIVHAACQCARLALPYCKDKQQRPLKAIETTEKWCRGEATLEEVKQVRDAAWDAASADTDAADYAVYVAAYYAAAYYSGHAVDAAVAAYCSGHAVDAADYAADAAGKSETADLVRSLIPMPTKLVDEYEHILKLKAFL